MVAYFNEPHAGNGDSDPSEVEAEWQEPVRDKLGLENFKQVQSLIYAGCKGIGKFAWLRGVQLLAFGAIASAKQRPVLADVESQKTITDPDCRNLMLRQIVLG